MVIKFVLVDVCKSKKKTYNLGNNWWFFNKYWEAVFVIYLLDYVNWIL